jgi:hypothetical protein
VGENIDLPLQVGGSRLARLRCNSAAAPLFGRLAACSTAPSHVAPWAVTTMLKF